MIKFGSYRDIVNFSKDFNLRSAICIIPSEFNEHDYLRKICDSVKNVLLLHFDDCTEKQNGLLPPTREHIEKAIRFIYNKNLYIACCSDNFACSSAIYCLRCYRPGIFTKLIKTAAPNALIIRYGSEIIDSRIYSEYLKWQQNVSNLLLFPEDFF